MKTFLEFVAEDIISKQGTDLSRTAIVFPNKRASLFINEHLARLADRPIWSPAYLTISELFRSQSEWSVADPIKLVSDIHKTFVEVTGIDETLDHFYGWGQLLLADFDDIDKNRADADHVFANIRDLHELDDISYLTDEQRAVIKRFFSNFNDDDHSELKQRFLKLWQHFADIYHRFQQRLADQQLAYEGMLYRDVVENRSITLNYDTYIFVGFNLLNKVEQALFRHLQQQGKAKFYWDFDDYYMKGHEAGFFISQYLSSFPNELDHSREEIYRQFANDKQIRFVAAPTENIQAHYIADWLADEQRKNGGKRTAILLCNENLLPMVIHSIPDNIGKVNITTGYPLAQTPIASLLTLLVAWQTSNKPKFYYKTIRQHPYNKWITDELLDSCQQQSDSRIHAILDWLCTIIRTIATDMSQTTDADPNAMALRSESIFRAYTLVNRMKGLAADGDLNIDSVTLQRLLRQLIQSTSIPFHGEPAEGIQVMGILESRNLDFDHIILLSCNEGNMPKGVNDSSFIPHSLRKVYGLTTVEHKTAIYAYYFHRLLQRATDITLVYNNGTDDGNAHEMSRFMLQLMVEAPQTIQHHYLKAQQEPTIMQPQAISKTPEIMQILYRRFVKRPNTNRPLLTPKAINSYRSCPLQFFYQYVSNLYELDDDELQIDDRLFGIIFHDAAQHLYEQMTQHGCRIEKAQIGQLLKSKTAVAQAVDTAFRKQLPAGAALNGLQLINREVIIHYLRQLLKLDYRQAPFEVYKLEGQVMCDWQVKMGDRQFTTTIGGTIDRLDAVDCDTAKERIRVVDYKTGGSQMKMAKDVDDIFADNDSHRGYYLQTLLYGNIVATDRSVNPHQLPVSPALLFIQHAASDDYDPTLCFGKEPISDILPYLEDFNSHLKTVIDEIFNPEIDFTPSPDGKSCSNCPYTKLCGKIS